MQEYDVVIAGGGHNGLACGAVLAKEGLKVLVAERGKWLGGGVVTREVTLPGFKHDLYGSSHVWIHANADFVKLLPELEDMGLKYIWANDHITGHPDKNGPGIIVYKDVNKTVKDISYYSEKDAKRYKEIFDGFVDVKDGFISNFFAPPYPPSYLPSVMENSEDGLDMLRNYNLSPLDFTLENFENDFIRTQILGWATAPGNNPIQEGKGDMFYIMIPAIHVFGESIPEGGTMQLPIAMAKLIEHYGGTVLTESPVKQFIVEDNEAKGIVLEDGQRIIAKKAVITNIDPKHTYLDMFEDGVLEDKFIQKVENYQTGEFTIVRAHYALNEAPKYISNPEMNKTPFQRIFGSVEDIIQQYAEIAMGIAPTNPFLWVACWTLVDPTRAPEGKHTLIMDTFVPMNLASGEDWEDIAEDYINNVELPKLQEYTSNMTEDNILAASIATGKSIERENPCFVDGGTTGGPMRMSQSGYFRPFPGYSQYRGPVKNFYMTGPYTHPGGAISAAGTITADIVLQDLGLREADF